VKIGFLHVSKLGLALEMGCIFLLLWYRSLYPLFIRELGTLLVKQHSPFSLDLGISSQHSTTKEPGNYGCHDILSSNYNVLLLWFLGQRGPGTGLCIMQLPVCFNFLEPILDNLSSSFLYLKKCEQCEWLQKPTKIAHTSLFSENSNFPPTKYGSPHWI